MRSPGLPALAGVFAVSLAAGVIVQIGARDRHRSDDAPGRTARRRDFGGYRVEGRTVTINAPRSDIYEHWRRPEKLMRFLAEVTRVEERPDGIFLWVLSASGDKLEIETKLVEDRPDELLAWRSTEGAEMDLEAKVQLRDAPAGRGTEVEAHIAYRPRRGIIGQWAGTLGGTDPVKRGRQELKRLKMLLETGEMATAAARGNF